MTKTFYQSKFYLKLVYLAFILFFTISSCFPGTNWPYSGDKINAPLIKVLNNLYQQENIFGWQNDNNVKDIINDYALMVNIILDKFYKPINLIDIQDSSVKAIIKKWNEGERSGAVIYEDALEKALLPLNDRYSRYMNAIDYSKYNDSNQNKLRGIGIIIEKVDKGLKIISFIKNSALENLNIPIGTIITAVDDIDISNLTILSSQKLLLGKVDTKVKIKFYEPKTLNTYTHIVKRKLILIDSIKSKLVSEGNQNILHIDIRNFNERSSSLFKKVLINNYLGEENPPIGILINLRNNPGGLVSEVITMVDWLLDKGMILRIVYKNNEDIYNTKLKDLVQKNIPVVILTNKYSASASEIFAGSLQSSKRAIVIGGKSYGKTVVQRTFRLSNGRGFKTTIGRYFIYGNIYLDKGITPNYSVKNLPDKKGDEVLQAGYNYILKEYKNSSLRLN